MKEFPADVDSYILLSDIEYELKDTQTAIETLRQAARLSPNYAVIYDKPIRETEDFKRALICRKS